MKELWIHDLFRCEKLGIRHWNQFNRGNEFASMEGRRHDLALAGEGTRAT
jgi:hypothetical protein